MAKLTYTAIASLDGFVADEDGRFDWSAPDEEVHAFVNELARPVGTYLLGRRMYDVLVVWENPQAFANDSPAMQEYASIWQAADKVVYSRTLQAVSSDRTRLERSFDPEAVQELKASSAAELSVSGPELAAQALRAGLVDEVRLFVSPVVVGGGTPALPAGVRLSLALLDTRRFTNGVVFLRYRIGARTRG